METRIRGGWRYTLQHTCDTFTAHDFHEPIMAPTIAHTQPFSTRLSVNTVLWLIKERALMAHSNAHFSDCCAIRTRTLIREGRVIFGEDMKIRGMREMGLRKIDEIKGR
jgi:hypothetical protein